jgi:uncharacterized membrane protein required for colicin V production
VQTVTKTTTGSAHVIGMIAFGIAIYLILVALSIALGTFAKLPILGIANNILGMPVGIVKAAVLVWAIVYVALFFPLSADVRHDLAESSLVHLATMPNQQIDAAVISTMPWFARPFVSGFLKSHRV